MTNRPGTLSIAHGQLDIARCQADRADVYQPANGSNHTSYPVVALSEASTVVSTAHLAAVVVSQLEGHAGLASKRSPH